jgi:hypothetical protein
MNNAGKWAAQGTGRAVARGTLIIEKWAAWGFYSYFICRIDDPQQGLPASFSSGKPSGEVYTQAD